MKSISLFVIALFSPSVTYSEPAFIDPNCKLVEWTGWGTSLAWFSDVLGGLDERVQGEMNYAMFSPERLNLNVLRYTIGGTTPGNYPCGPFRQGCATESFRDGPNEPYIWTRDPRARKVLLDAKALGADVFEAFSNSPPAWLTRTGCTKGREDGGPLHDNFDPVNAEAFADYLTEVVKHYHENYNVTFTSLAPFNEPSSGYWSGYSKYQEGCNMERSTMIEVIKSVHASLQAKNLTFCGVSVADETEINEELLTQRTFTAAGIAGLYSKVNTHGYSDNGRENRAELYTLADRNKHVLWMDEMGWSRSNLEDMTQGLNLAERIVTDLKTMVPSAWVYWQVIEDQQPGMWGILDVPYANATVDYINYNSGYYAMMQYSKYIRKGFTIINVNDKDTIAAYDSTSQTLVVVILNRSTSSVQKSIDLLAFPQISQNQIEAFRTSPTEPHISITSPSIVDGTLEYSAPSKSVTTFKIRTPAREYPNLVRNGDFEDPSDNPWFLLYGQRDDSGINGEYVHRGARSGYVDYSGSELSLMQNVTVGESRQYFLSAWCATSGPNTKFGVLVNGRQGPEVVVPSWRGYQLMGHTVNAVQGDVISIYIYSQRGDHNAQIDDVELH